MRETVISTPAESSHFRGTVRTDLQLQVLRAATGTTVHTTHLLKCSTTIPSMMHLQYFELSSDDYGKSTTCLPLEAKSLCLSRIRMLAQDNDS